MSAPTPVSPPPPTKRSAWKSCLVIALILGGIFVVCAAIAVPNFVEFNCKTIEHGGLSDLAGLFTAEKAFRMDHGFYTSDLVSLGWSPDSEHPRFVVGFATSGPGVDAAEAAKTGLKDYDERRKDTSIPSVATALKFATDRMTPFGGGRPLGSADLPADTFVSRDHFLIGAAGDADGDPTLGVWTIDDTKKLVLVKEDCTFW